LRNGFALIEKMISQIFYAADILAFIADIQRLENDQSHPTKTASRFLVEWSAW
jgi:hypothetical protein